MKELYKALSDFQEECPSFVKDTQAFNYKYVQLPDIAKVVTPLLKKHGLLFMQSNATKDGMIGVMSSVIHIGTGQKITSELYSDLAELKGMNIYQTMGSAITYIRRYDMSTLLGLQSEKDNDGAGEHTRKPIAKRKPVAKKSEKELLTPDTPNWSKAVDYMAKEGSDINTIAKHYNISDEHLALLNK